MANQKWADFYRKCMNEKVGNIDNPIEKQKIELIGQQQGVLRVDEPITVDFFQECKKAYEEVINKEQKVAEKNYVTI